MNRITADVVEFIDDVEQGTHEWFDLRRGLPTASRFSAIIAEAKDGVNQKMRTKLLRLLAAEVIGGKPMETYSNSAMERGREMEPWAISQYEFVNERKVRRVGFVRRTVATIADPFIVGCSPDALVDDVTPKRVLQVKTMQPDLILGLIDHTAPPPEFRAQVQGELWVTGYEAADLMICFEGFPISPVFSILRDEHYIARLRDEVERFVWDLKQLIARVRQKGWVF